MNIAFCWTEISGYMGACWRALSNIPDVDVRVLARPSSSRYGFDDRAMRHIDWIRLDEKSYSSRDTLVASLDEFQPDVVIISGWTNRAYRSLSRRLAGSK